MFFILGMCILLLLANWDLINDTYTYSLQAIRTGWVHPNINLENPDDSVVCCFALKIHNSCSIREICIHVVFFVSSELIKRNDFVCFMAIII